ncbi:MAG: DNA adenine methylase [Candidatus Sabulitectum sp.]|nr:DNA adenine methylase [Candidatus Sabulitectum sp.]
MTNTGNRASKPLDVPKSTCPPTVIKYMGSKRKILSFIVNSIRDVHDGELICDLFSGTGIVGSALKNDARIWSNDIQEYSSILANAYMNSVDPSKYMIISNKVFAIAEAHVEILKRKFPILKFSYNDVTSLGEFQVLEKKQQELINLDFKDQDYHLFTKIYSGTYWSCEQCMWIDGYRLAADMYRDKSIYPILLASLMHAMAYNAQSTGHYAQYRDANDTSSMSDILKYRTKSISPYYRRKLKQLLEYSSANAEDHVSTTLGYTECLELLPESSLVYADPPYAFVHYSRFYHTLETLVKYDYPSVRYKGRYRDDRHQSPFCQKSNVEMAFKRLLEICTRRKHKLLISYSNNGMITLDDITAIIEDVMPNYMMYIKQQNHIHSTMGRLNDKSRDVTEVLIILKPR